MTRKPSEHSMAKAKQMDIDEVLAGINGKAPPPAATPPEIPPDLASDPARSRDADGEGAEASPQDPAPAPEPLVRLPPEAFDDLRLSPAAAFSDDPPEGWGSGQGNVLTPDPVQAVLDPVAEARRSLLEDAARASGGAPAPAPTTPVAVTRRGSSAPDIRQALARAAARPNTTQYRSRVTVGSAWQYDGALHTAPDWVDRNWAAYEDGPAINVPDIGIVKKNQWIVVQQVLDDHGVVDFTELKVYDDAVFRSLFMPVEPVNAE